MAYTFVDFNRTHANLTRDIAEAKTKGQYAGRERAWDQTVLKALSERVQASIAVTDDYKKKVQEHHTACKDTLDKMEALIKKKGKNLAEADTKVLQTSGRFIATAEEQIRTINADMFTSLSEYRAGWPDDFRNLLSNPALVEPLKAARAKTIDDGKHVDALKKRLAEYLVRAQDLLKVATQNTTKGSTLAGDAAGAIRGFKTDTEALKMQFDIYANKASNSLKQIADLPPKQKIDPKLVAMNQSRLTNGQAEAKNARGQQKTLDLKIETFKKLSAKLDGADKKAAAAQTAAAAALAKGVDTAEKALAKLEASAVKVWTAIGKLK
jgi:hypothetical protein